MNELTRLKLDCILLAVEERRITGAIHPTAEVTPRQMERIGNEKGISLSHKTIRVAVQKAAERLNRKLSAEGIKADAIRSQLSSDS